MATSLSFSQQVERFEENEERANTFVNGDEDATWTSSGGTVLPSVEKLINDADIRINEGEDSLFAASTAAVVESASNANIAEDAANLAQASAENAQASSRTVGTWAELATLTPALMSEGAEVLDTDLGTHTDPSTSTLVPNAGRYRAYATTVGSWTRIGATGLSSKASNVVVSSQGAAITGVTNNFIDSEKSLEYKKGVLFDFPSKVFISSGISASDPNNLPSLTSSRASAAYAVNDLGFYQSFPVNTLRVTTKGALIEGAATQLCTQPLDFTNATWGKTSSSVNSLAASAPDGASVANEIVELTTSSSNQSYIFFTSASLSPGTYVASFHVKKSANRYVMLLATVNGQSGGWTVDFDAAGGPTFSWATGSGLGDSGSKIQEIGNGWYRISAKLVLSGTGTISYRLQGSGGLTYADRTYATVAGRKIVVAAMSQLELGQNVTSPILVSGATRAADVVTIALPSGVGQDPISVTWEGGTSVNKRSDLVSGSIFNLVTDLGAPWGGSYIKSITLRPTFNHKLLEKTPSGSIPWYVAMEGTNFLNGDAFTSEEEIVKKLGGTISGSFITASGYVAPDAVNLLQGTDFTSNIGEWTVAQDATAGVADGYLTMSVTGAITASSVVARKLIADGSKAYKFSGTVKQSLSNGQVQLAIANRIDFAAGINRTTSYASTTDSVMSVIGSGIHGDGFYAGLYQLANTPATVGYLKNPSLVEVSPGPSFPSGNVMVEIQGVAPNPLPSATQVIVQFDDTTENNRAKLEIDPDGSLHLRERVGAGADGQSADLNIGSVTAGSTFNIVAGFAMSLMRGAVNGTGATLDVILPIGMASMRFGKDSLGGSVFTGSITGKRVLAGVETLDWMKNRTSAKVAEKPIYTWFEGDSYSGETTGMSQIMAASLTTDYDKNPIRVFNIVRTGAGGSTLVQQNARILANATLYKDRCLFWWDGDPNGHVAGTTAEDIALIDSAIAALGHKRFLYVRNGQIPKPSNWTQPITSRGQEGLDMDIIYEYVKRTYGPEHVYDPLTVLKTLVKNDLDQSDVNYGYFPRSCRISSGDVHMTIESRRVLSKGFNGIPGMDSALIQVSKY